MRPVVPREREQLPVFTIAKWIVDGGVLTKTYEFLDASKRNAFVNDILDYEANVGHEAWKIEIEALKVRIVLVTRNVDEVTQLDKEYARYADSTFKDLLYDPSHVET